MREELVVGGDSFADFVMDGIQFPDGISNKQK